MLRFNPQSPPRHPRRGAILLVVLALLALFAVIGLSFVLYAESEANAARVARDAKRVPADSLPPDPQPSAENVIAQILYGDSDNDRSAFYGHSLAALKYGGQGGTAAYNGVGTIAGGLAGFPAATGIADNMLNRQDVIHWSRFGSGANSEYLIDPEHVIGGGPFTVRTETGSYPNNLYSSAGTKRPANDPTLGAIYVPKNAAYTYPDRNNALLALVTPPEPGAVTDAQQIVAVSGYRPSLFGSLAAPTGVPTDNLNWTNKEGRHKILRPRPADHILPGETAAQSQFPYPPANADGTYTGDLQNYSFQNGPQRNDSVWMYPGLAVTDYKGKKITAMVAPMLLPLDGRVNLNAAGNTLAAGNHGSHSGFGPHEIALWRVLQSANTAAAITQAQTAAQQILQQRYNGSVPNPAELPNAGVASSLVMASPPGTHYPASPTPGSGVPANGGAPSPFAVQTFHPAPVPFTISGTGPTSVLQANQFLPPAGSQVNFGAAAASYTLPGSYAPDPTMQYRYYGTTPDYTQWTNPPSPLVPSYSSFTAANAAMGKGAYGDTVGHPLLWNPLRRGAFERGTPSAITGVFPISDLRYTAARYSVNATDIQNQTFLGEPLSAGAGRQFNGNTPTFSQSGPSSTNNVNRALTTPISNSQQAAMLGANFLSATERTLQLPTPMTFTPDAVFPTLSANSTFSVSAPGGGAGSDAFDGSGSNQQLANRLARLGPIDLNRPLTSYPTDQTSPAGSPTLGKLTATAMQTYPQQLRTAGFERQTLAHDIFVRMAFASGAKLNYDGVNFTVDATVGTQGYDALRWLAQYAANIVDAIDGDDISTQFVWNPAAAMPMPGTLPTSPSDPNYDTSLAGAIGNDHTRTTVYGVEKPRLVLNEVYAELTNDEQDALQMKATRPFQARFFVELLNPGVTDTNTLYPSNVPLISDSAGTLPSYRLQVFDNSGAVRNDLLMNNANIAGTVTSRQPLIQMDTANLGVAQQSADAYGNPVGQSEYAVEPNDGFFLATGNQRRGFALIGPGSATAAAFNTKLSDGMGAPTFAPAVDSNADKFSLMIQKKLPANTTPTTYATTANLLQNMAYFVEKEKDTELTMMGNAASNATPLVAHDQLAKRHAVVLQRLANPYLPFGSTSNPWITVDVVYDVKLFDAVRVAEESVMGNNNGMRMTQPMPQNFGSIGRSQPLAGYMPPFIPATLTAPYPATGASAPDPYFTTGGGTTRANQLPATRGNLTLRQKMTSAVTGTLMHNTFMTHNADNAAPPPAPPGTPGSFPGVPIPNQTNPQPPGPGPANPAFSNNQSDKNMQFPFAWMPHFDRPLINQEELLHVATVKPHELTAKFAQPATYNPAAPAPNPPDSAALDNRHTLAYYLENRAGMTLETTTLARGLEFLQVKSRVHDTPVGGRVAGKVNVNLIWDRKVFDALLDQNGGSSFTATQVDQMWTDFYTSRTPSYPAVSVTNDEAAAAPTNDRPFKTFGTPTYAVSTNRLSQSGIDDTLLRVVPGAQPRLLFSAPSQSHPYAKAEPLRKILNNVTTTTDTFLLITTVSFFEVRNPIASTEHYYNGKDGVPVVLGKEVFKEVPGDLRAQFVAVLDRSNLTIPESPVADTAIPGVPAAPATPYLPLTTPPSLEGGLWVIETASDMVQVPSAGGVPNTQVSPAGGTYSVQVNLYSQPTATNPVVPGAGTPNFGPNELPSQPVATGSYATRDEDRDPARNFSIVGGNGTLGTGSRFAIGTGPQRVVLEALATSASNPWTYDPLSGRTRIPVQVVTTNPLLPTSTPVPEEPTDPNLRSYPAGTMLSNARFGARIVLTPTPGVTPRRGYGEPSLDLKTPSPQVPLFGKLPSP